MQVNTIKELKTYNLQTKDYQNLLKLLKEPASLNWLFTGDSITQGVMHTKGLKTFSEYFAAYLKNDLARSEDIVMNTGVSSAKTTWLAADFKAYISFKNPDIVFICFAMNDARPAEGQVALDKYIEILSRAITKVRQLGAIPILETSCYALEAEYNDSLDLYFAALRNLAKEKQVILIDIARHWQDLSKDKHNNEKYMSNNMHPNALGQLYWAKSLLMDLDLLKTTSWLYQARTIPEKLDKLSLKEDFPIEENKKAKALAKSVYAPKQASTSFVITRAKTRPLLEPFTAKNFVEIIDEAIRFEAKQEDKYDRMRYFIDQSREVSSLKTLNNNFTEYIQQFNPDLIYLVLESQDEVEDIERFISLITAKKIKLILLTPPELSLNRAYLEELRRISEKDNLALIDLNTYLNKLAKTNPDLKAEVLNGNNLSAKAHVLIARKILIDLDLLSEHSVFKDLDYLEITK